MNFNALPQWWGHFPNPSAEQPVQIATGVRSQNNGRGYQHQAQLFQLERMSWDLTFHFVDREMDNFRTYWKNFLRNGMGYFKIFLQTENGREIKIVRMVGGQYEATLHRAGLWTVRFSVEEFL